jgi:hypothetical protein
MMDELRSEAIHTWFDLGLFLDRFKEHRRVPSVELCGSTADLYQMIAGGGIAFVSFEFGVGATALEAAEYARAFEQLVGDAPIHYVAGALHAPAAEGIASSRRYELQDIQGFRNWALYDDFFQTRLERGSKRYNELIGEFWDQVLVITHKLGEYIEANDIHLLCLLDICAVPGNVSLALAAVFISEYLGLPVINRNHAFYWEEGGRGRDVVFTNTHIGEFFSQIDVLFPWESRSWMHVNSSPEQSRYLVEMKGHNPANVAEMPANASPQAVQRGLRDVLHRLHLQLAPNDRDAALVKQAVADYSQACAFRNQDLDALLPSENRHYLPGYGRTGLMLFLKSLIDPSYFRVEEQQIRGMVMRFAQGLVEHHAPASLHIEVMHRFHSAVDNLFRHRAGKVEIRHDHSFAYRHRNTIHYPYRDLTHQELTGLVNVLFQRILSLESAPMVDAAPPPGADRTAAPAGWTRPAGLAIDDVERMLSRWRANTPIAYFPGNRSADALSSFVVHPIRWRLGLGAGEHITAQHLQALGEALAPIYIFCAEKPCRRRTTARWLADYVASGSYPELALLFQHGICRIVPTQQWCVGIHFPQLGAEALRILHQIQQQGGCIVTDDADAALMTDIVDVDRFHIGTVNHVLASKMMGIPLGSQYVQFVPAGTRTTLAYPTPIQTARDFHDALHSPRYARLCERYGEAEVLRQIRAHGQARGSPVRAVLAALDSAGDAEDCPTEVEHSYLCGLYQDNQPWSGVVARVGIQGSSRGWRFAILSGQGGTKRVTDFAEEFAAALGTVPAVAWNGGFILNAELVGKLGLPESYIGSPLGLIISSGQVICPPLFNKPAFLVYPDGRLDIRRVSCSQGIFVSDGHHRFALGPAARNPKRPAPDKVCFYDLMWDEEAIPGHGRVLLRLAGNVIKEVIHTTPGQEVPTVPVGLTLSFPAARFPEEWSRPEKSLRIEMRGWEPIEHAIEAGPMLVDGGKNGIDMQVEGWKTRNSIRTQAARMDYTDMRGPKIAIGLDGSGNLSVLAINGRIRESVGATHVDMAEILIGLGMQKAMGFDPGGSSTLVVAGKALNISPYNAGYENDVYSLPPEPRAVANAVVGYQE